MRVNFLLDDPETIAIRVVIDGRDVGRAHWFVLGLAGAGAGAGASLCGLTALRLRCLLLPFLGETLARPVAFLLAVVALAFAAFPVVAIGYGEGDVILALGLALAGLILGRAAGLCTVGLLGNHVDQLRHVHRRSSVPAGNGEGVEGLSREC